MIMSEIDNTMEADDYASFLNGLELDDQQKKVVCGLLEEVFGDGWMDGHSRNHKCDDERTEAIAFDLNDSWTTEIIEGMAGINKDDGG